MRNELRDLGLDNDEIREVIEHLRDEDDDFEVGKYRFIADDAIDEIQVNEMLSDEYILGCSSSWAIADATGWPIVLIEAAQKGEAYQEIGEAMSKKDVQRLQQIYAAADGYGHHFATYDGDGRELELDGRDFHAFRVE